ncbi:hypothetical protein E2P81_ATG07803 [Venturia nashicola]|nr:hypothetical protein E2P81_ATG07803 [Venturia nashicola]
MCPLLSEKNFRFRFQRLLKTIMHQQLQLVHLENVNLPAAEISIGDHGDSDPREVDGNWEEGRRRTKSWKMRCQQWESRQSAFIVDRQPRPRILFWRAVSRSWLEILFYQSWAWMDRLLFWSDIPGREVLVIGHSALNHGRQRDKARVLIGQLFRVFAKA